jgi:hypothetical protein
LFNGTLNNFDKGLAMTGWLANSKIRNGKYPIRSRVSVPKFGVEIARKTHSMKEYIRTAKINKR